MKKAKVLHIIPNFGVGGAEKLVLDYLTRILYNIRLPHKVICFKNIRSDKDAADTKRQLADDPESHPEISGKY